MGDWLQTTQLAGLRFSPKHTAQPRPSRFWVNWAVEFRQCLLGPPSLGLTEEGRVSTEKPEINVYGNELGSVPGAVLTKG